MFLGRGFAGTSVDAVAHEAGYTTGAVYSNFGGKADLFLAVLEKTTDDEGAAVRAALADAVTDEQRLGVFTSALIRDQSRWQARVAATLEFVSAVRDDSQIRARTL